MMWVGMSLSVIGAAFVAAGVEREPRIIRPPDDRVDYYATTAALQAIGDSVAAQFEAGVLTDNGDGTFSIPTTTLADNNNPLCAGERFGDQPASASCTATLVAPDVLITAGHCLDENGTRVDLSTIRFVFDYAVRQEGVNPSTFNADQVYEASEIIGLANVEGTADDWALVRLNRAVTGRTPVGVRSSGEIAVGEGVVAVGFGAGLPIKFSDNATVQTLVDFGFEADFDIIAGNSGGPIINAATGLIEAVLSADQAIDDFRQDGDCFRATVCPQDPECDASFTLLASVMNAPFQAAIRTAVGNAGGDGDGGVDDGGTDGDGDGGATDGDEDGDGVPDEDDFCQGTTDDVDVDEDGCGPDDILEDEGGVVASPCGAVGLIPMMFMMIGVTLMRRPHE